MNVLNTVDVAVAKSHYIDAPLGRIHVVETGTGAETIMLWPSIFTDHRIYDQLVAGLGHQFRFSLIDGYGHGQSEGPETAFDMHDCAEAMACVLDEFEIAQAVVGGTSWGGMTSAELALAHPDRVKSLILMNTPMDIGAQSPGMSTRMIALGVRWMSGRAMFRDGLAKSFFTPSALAQNSAYEDAFHGMLRRAKPKQLSAAIRSVMLRGSPLTARIADTSPSTLIIAGKDDSM